MLLRREGGFFRRGGGFLRRGGGEVLKRRSVRGTGGGPLLQKGGWLLKKGGVLKKPVEVLKEFDPLPSTLSVPL